MPSTIKSSSPANSVEAFAEPRRREVATDDPERNDFAPNNANKRPNVVLNDGNVSANQRQSFGSYLRRSSLNQTAAVPQDHIQIVRPSDPRENTYIPEFKNQLFGEATTAHDAENQEPGRSLKINYEAFENFTKTKKQDNGNIPGATSDHNVEDPEKQPCSRTENACPSSGVEMKNFATPSETKQTNSLFSFFSSSGGTTTIQARDLGGLLTNGITSFRDLFRTDGENGIWWLDVFDPDEEELLALCHAFSLHRLTTEDIQTQEWREKVELFRHYYFVCFRTFTIPEGEEVPEYVNVYLIVFREGVVTFSFSRPTAHASNVRQRIAQRHEVPSLSSDWICYAMIDDIVDSFAPITRDAEKAAGILEDEVSIARQNDFGPLLQRIGLVRKKVMSLLRLLGGKADVIKGLAKRCNEEYEATPRGYTELYHGDIQDHVVMILTNLAHLEKVLSRLHGNYLASLFVKDIMVGNHINSSLTRITILATFLMPLTILTLVFGMNVHVPGQDGGMAWFWSIVGVMVVLFFVGACIAKRYKLI